MNKTLLAFAIMTASGIASASAFFEDRAPFNENPDLYGGSGASAMLHTAQQPGVGDTYGGSVFNNTELMGTDGSRHHPFPGTGDAYGSPIPNVEEGTLNW